MKNKGVALVTVLIVLAVIAPLLTRISVVMNRSVKISSDLYHAKTAIYYALVAERWSRDILDEDKKQSSHDGFDEVWAQTIPPLEADEGVVTGRLIDLQGRFNINNLLDNNNDINQTFIRLLVNLEFSESSAMKIKNAIFDWMDTNAETTVPGGAEDDYYVSLPNPYRSAGQKFLSVTELRMVKGITPEIYAVLVPNLSALPARVKININTAEVAVLKALFPEEDWLLIDEFANQRTRFGIRSIADFKILYKNATGKELDQKIINQISLKSSYFLADIKTKFGANTINLNSILARSRGKTTTYVRSFTGGV